MKEIRKATVDDARRLAPRLRASDRRECITASGMTPEVLLPLSVRYEEDVYVFTDAGTPEVIFGVSPVQHYPLLGLIWMLASDRLPEYRREIVTKARTVIDGFHDKYPLLGNHVDARNVEHRRWLRWCGFRLLRVIPEYGLDRTPFIEFAKLREPNECASAP